MKADLRESMKTTLVEALRLCATHARNDVLDAIKNAMESETSTIARDQLSCILDNMKMGIRDSLPYCQDTGSIHFFLRLGDGFPIRSGLPELLREVIQDATALIPLRPNTVDPVSDMNLGANLGNCIPDIDIILVPGDELQVDVMLKGGGSENMSRLMMLPPLKTLESLPLMIARIVVDAGGKPCPPIILGIGIGGSASSCMKMAKKSLLRPLGLSNSRPELAELESEILSRVNGLGIGTMGLGGDVTALAVHLESCPRHPASFPVGVIFQCYAHRHARITISPNGSCKIRDDFNNAF